MFHALNGLVDIYDLPDLNYNIAAENSNAVFVQFLF